MREDTYKVDVRVTIGSDTRDLGTWDKFSGGAFDSESTNVRQGGMAKPRPLGGGPVDDPFTVAVLFEPDKHDVHWLKGGRGRGTVVATKQTLDADGHAWGRPLVYTGKLKTVTPPDHDATGNAAAYLTITADTLDAA